MFTLTTNMQHDWYSFQSSIKASKFCLVDFCLFFSVESSTLYKGKAMLLLLLLDVVVRTMKSKRNDSDCIKLKGIREILAEQNLLT